MRQNVSDDIMLMMMILILLMIYLFNVLISGLCLLSGSILVLRTNKRDRHYYAHFVDGRLKPCSLSNFCNSMESVLELRIKLNLSSTNYIISPCMCSEG